MSNTKPASLRQTMPKTAEWVDRMRAQHGEAWVNEQIRSALAGVPGCFYAMEGGRTLGKPFPPTHPIHTEQRMAVMLGCEFAGFIATPTEQADGTH